MALGTPIELRRLAYDFATKLNLKNNFDTEKKLAGKDWLYGFLRRNPEIRLREPDNTSINRIPSFNEEEVSRFYTNLQKVFEKHAYPPSRIFNQDETGISNVQKKSAKVYDKKGQKRVGTATSAERGRTITLVCCVSASGSYVPPMIIYPRMRIAAHLKRGGPAGTVYECSKNGWSNEQLFVKWLEHFCAHTKPSKDDPVLLICDNHGSHITLEAYEVCKKNHITLVSIPPHTSHRLQPLDLTFFGPLKSALSREFGLFMTQHAHTKILTSDIPSLLNNAYVKVATMEKGIKGFSAAGIYPLNPDKFTSEDFAPANEFRELVVEDDPETPSRKEQPVNDLRIVPGPSGIQDELVNKPRSSYIYQLQM
ncbi:MFS-type transporter clz9-like [Homalodisca vitripennis]|uniref:MFS-type transporter clz9-like n=1 Tax=Homalodisca vitripennis TaxID=197043 RepID=UPI001EECDE4B|nr:MFS-type transporter clz9-like [Homalodisca vitripennis]